jgi:hypothetical protein
MKGPHEHSHLDRDSDTTIGTHPSPSGCSSSPRDVPSVCSEAMMGAIGGTRVDLNQC